MKGTVLMTKPTNNKTNSQVQKNKRKAKTPKQKVGSSENLHLHKAMEPQPNIVSGNGQPQDI